MRPTPRPVFAPGVAPVCATCGKRLDAAADMVLVAFIVRPAGQEPTEYRVYACGTAHAAEAMRRTAAAIEERAFTMPEPGSVEWSQQHGVLVSATD